MRILFLHQNFPGQYVHLARWFHGRPGCEVRAITDAGNERPEIIPTIRYPSPPKLETFGGPSGGRRYAEGLQRAEAAAVAAINLRNQGFRPDVILGHGAWGETLFMKEVWPDAKVMAYAEFYYASQGRNVGFDPEFDATAPGTIRTITAHNALMAMAVLNADAGLAPTRYQADTFPAELRPKIARVFDGVDTDMIAPDPQAVVTIEQLGITFRAGEPIITFINRNLEPYRGYHIFMRALPKVLKAVPDARAILIGGDGVSYGAPAPDGKKWKDIFLEEVKDRLDLSRVHFVGRIPHNHLMALYKVSAAHVYLTYPFVLSWSCIEALAAGALVIGSDVEPVREVISHGENGLLTPFFDVDALAETMIAALKDQKRFQPLRNAARARARLNYDLKSVCLPAQIDMLHRFARTGDVGGFAAPKHTKD